MGREQTGLVIIHANRLEKLRDLLVGWICSNPIPPLENEHILVQSNGIAQWLRMSLAASEQADPPGCGIAAAMQLELPSAFLWQAYRAVLGEDAVPRQSPYDKPRLVWRLYRMLPQLLARPSFQPLNEYLNNDPSRRKLYQLAQRLSDLYDQYQVYRADWLNDWAAGNNQLNKPDGSLFMLDQTQQWQAELWREIREDLQQERDLSRADLHAQFIQACGQLKKRPARLPRRLLVFGISALPQQMIEALAALSDHMQILIAVHNPCRHYWADIIEGRELLRSEFRRQQRREGTPVNLTPEEMHIYAPPLLAAWGKQGRDYIRLLDEFDQSDKYRQWFTDSRIDLFDDPVSEPQALPLLQQLQQDILELNPAPSQPRQLHADDQSIVFHMAHSPQRETEILQDQLIARFAADPTMRARDVIVMVPDIATYQPHIDAVFGRLDRKDPRYLPYTLADQLDRGRLPMLVALEQILSLPESRLGVDELISLLEVPATQTRFGLVDSDIATLQHWIAQAGVRWGLDSRQRQGLGLPDDLEQNSWLFGLQRMLLGYAVGDGEAFADIEPYSEVSGLEAALAGPLAALIQELRDIYPQLTVDHSAAEWVTILNSLLKRFFAASDDQDLLLLERLGNALQAWFENCQSAELHESLPLVIVREAWLEGIDNSALTQRFMAGSITFSTLMPMRAIPFKQIFLLGMNDGDYPRLTPAQDFDLMANDYRPGDRSRREDDRYLFLEALLSARDALYISWVARSVRDNQPQPSSVLVAQLREHIEHHWQIHEKGDALAQLDTRHPLQPFSPAYFSADQQRLFTYAKEWRQVHEAPLDDNATLSEWVPSEAIGLVSLQRFLRQPVRTFFQERLKIYLTLPDPGVEDHEPFNFNALDHYKLGQQLLDQCCFEWQQQGSAFDAEQALQQACDRLERAGALPMGEWKRMELDQPVLSPVHAVLNHLQPLYQDWQLTDQALEIDLSVPVASSQSVTVQDWVTELYHHRQHPSQRYLRIQTSPLAMSSKGEPRWHRLLSLWVTHLAANACGYELQSWMMGPKDNIVIDPIEQEEAQQLFNQLVERWYMAMQAPAQVACKTAIKYLKPGDKDEPLTAAFKTYEGGFNMEGECAGDPLLQRAWPTFETLADGLDEWAKALYKPLMDHAEIIAVSRVSSRAEGSI